MVESGNLGNDPANLGLIISTLAGLHYDAVGLGYLELGACKDQFFAEAQKDKLTVIDTRPDPARSAVPYVIKNVDGVKVGIVSFGAIVSDQPIDEYQRRKAMYTAYKAARDAAEVLIVLDEANVVTQDWLDRNGKRLGVPDIVVSGEQKRTLAEPQVLGTTRIVPTSDQGKQVHYVDVEIAAGAEPKFVYNRIVLDPSVAQDTAVKATVDELLHPREVTPTNQTVAAQSSVPQSPGAERYYSPGLCKGCHVTEYEDWSKTKHAAALKTLSDAGRMLPECLQCHSEQYRRNKTVTIAKDNVGGVECATCHMEALPHGMARTAVAIKTKVKALECLDCHTKDRSPKYDQAAYFPKISHAGVAGTHTASATVSKPQ